MRVCIPVIPKYPLSLAAGPIRTLRVESCSRVIVLPTKTGQLAHEMDVPLQRSTGSLARWIGGELAAYMQKLYSNINQTNSFWCLAK